jgi:hypothetical protein
MASSIGSLVILTPLVLSSHCLPLCLMKMTSPATSGLLGGKPGMVSHQEQDSVTLFPSWVTACPLLVDQQDAPVEA